MPEQIDRIDGFDYLRVAGVAMVLLQHQLSILGLEPYTSFLDINLGQTGVALFLAVSGALAVKSHRPPCDWLLTRLSRIYPAFWIATAVSFIAAGVSGYKTFDAYQVVSQLAGTGLLTHRGQLVNVATWFVSLLLMLYVAVFFARLTKQQTAVVALLAAAAVALVCLDVDPLIFAHATTFFVAALVFGGERRTRLLYLIAPVLLALAIYDRHFSYPLISLVVTGLATRLPKAPRLVMMLSEHSYEFYLIHGIFLVGSRTVVGDTPLISVPLGIGSAVIAAVLLKHAASFLLQLAKRKPREPIAESGGQG